MPLTISYRLRPEVELQQADGALWLFCPHTGKAAHWNSGRPLPLVEALAAGWLDRARMATIFTPEADLTGAALLELFIARLVAAWLVDMRVDDDQGEAFTVSPAPDEALLVPAPGAGAGLRLNRFAYLRAGQGGLLLESPLTPQRILLRDPALAGLVMALARGDDATSAGAGSAALLGLLLGLGLAEADVPEPADDPLAYWEFHDLLFHARSSHGRHAYPVGGTYRFQGRQPAPPLLKPATGLERVDLPAPTGEMAARLRAPFCEVLEGRRSLRQFSARAMGLAELGAFLQAAARLQATLRDRQHDDELSLRPHAGGGARHPLEIYPLVRACDGLAAGAYHYDPAGHALERLVGDPARLEELFAQNPHVLEGPHPPQVSLYIAARIGRTAWKYQSIAYKIINQDLGCLYQTFYLVGAALGLAPCAIGSVDPFQAGAALGLDWREEPCVGLFTLGCPAGEPAARRGDAT